MDGYAHTANAMSVTIDSPTLSAACLLAVCSQVHIAAIHSAAARANHPVPISQLGDAFTEVHPLVIAKRAILASTPNPSRLGALDFSSFRAVGDCSSMMTALSHMRNRLRCQVRKRCGKIEIDPLPGSNKSLHKGMR